MSLINEIKNYPNITLKGFMTMGPLNDDLFETEKVGGIHTFQGLSLE